MAGGKTRAVFGRDGVVSREDVFFHGDRASRGHVVVVRMRGMRMVVGMTVIVIMLMGMGMGMFMLVIVVVDRQGDVPVGVPDFMHMGTRMAAAAGSAHFFLPSSALGSENFF